jgi:hypothetical protein
VHFMSKYLIAHKPAWNDGFEGDRPLF